MPTVFRSPSSGPITIGDEYRLFKQTAVAVPVVDDLPLEEKKDAEDSTKETVDIKRTEEKGSDDSQEQQESKKRSRGEGSGSDDGASDGKGSEGAPGAQESKRSKTTAVPGEGTDDPQVGESSTGVRAEREQSDAKQETKQESGGSQV